MIVLVGASASGKTEVAKILASKYHIVKMITTTTRPKRINEVDKVDYFFIDINEFIKKIDEGFFVEYTNYNNNYYGSGKDQIGENKAIVVDPQGLKSFQALNDKNIVTFLLMSDEKIRFDRMIKRGDKLENAKERILRDRIEFSEGKVTDVDFKIDSENYTLEEIADTIYRLYKKELLRRNS